MPGPHLSNPNSTELGSVGKLTNGVGWDLFEQV